MSTYDTILDDVQESEPNNSLLEQIRQYITNNLASDLSDTIVARHFQISASSLRHIFKRSEKLSFGKYVELIRMKKAMEMIKAGKWTQEIMDATGYNNRVTFFNAFKNTFRYSPRHFR